MAHLNGAPQAGRGPWTLPVPVHVLVFASLGVLSTYAMLQLWSAMATAEQPLLWWAGRALGFLAYIALWLSMCFGALVSSGGAGGLVSKKWIMDFHQEWTLVAVVSTVLHIIVLVTHAESRVTPWAAIIPFVSATLTGPVALGTIAAIGLAVIVASSWIRTRVPYPAWRALHALSFGVMMLALAHSVASGTDTGIPAAGWLYVVTTASLAGVIVMRIGVALASPRRSVG
ncbi:MAG: ferric reductase-like transmembrane domain-containing protein [Dehalococcoidia bacterium]